MKQLFLIAVFLTTAVDYSSAQPAESTSAAKLPLARRLYEEGMAATEEGRWSIAFDRFKASHELAPRAQTLFNLAGAQSHTGRLVEAAESYRAFLRETADGRFSEFRPAAIEHLEALDRQIVQVTLDVTNLEAGDVIAIDEIEFPHGVLRAPIPLNPGSHVARVRRGASVIASRTLTLAAGATESIRFELPAKPIDLTLRRPPASPAVSSAAATPSRPAPRPGRAWLRSPWLWSGVAVVVAGTAGGAYLLTRPDGVVIH